MKIKVEVEIDTDNQQDLDLVDDLMDQLDNVREILTVKTQDLNKRNNNIKKPNNRSK